MSRRIGSSLLGCTVLASAALGAGAVRADTAAAASPAQQSLVNEVIVQARRRALQSPVTADKTGTPIQDVPASIQVIPREVLLEQGVTMLRDSLTNASGVNYGGQDLKGYYDHFEIRGLDAESFEDNFGDGDQLNGLSHSLNGVERIEVLAGPGSALFGSGPPGGTINIIHYAPSPDPHYGASLQAGSFGTINNTDYLTGPTGVAGLDYRLDVTFAGADGFRDLKSHDYEARPAIAWRVGAHQLTLTLDLRQQRETPDSYGLIYFHGAPITGVPIDAKYSTPFAFADNTFVRPTVSDVWVVNDVLTVDNHFSYLHRTLNVLTNGDSTNTKVSGGQVVGRQLRRQEDDDDSLDYQLEPVWRFALGPMRNILLTGFEYQRMRTSTFRRTADLPNIPDAFAPVPPETSLAGLTFLCDAKHSCDDALLAADYYALYATDQIDVTEQLKVRAGVRQDWFDTALTPRVTVPGRFDLDGNPVLAGVTNTRDNAPVSWNAGALYKVTPWASPYVGVAMSHLSNFNSESTQSGIGPPESALEYEAGVKFAFLDARWVLNTDVFSIERQNVPAATTLAGVETIVFDAQRTRGGEATLDARITDRWSLSANVTFQDAVITDNPQGIASVGKHPQGVPAEIANLWTTYDFAIAGVPGFRVGGGVNYQSKRDSDLTNVNAIPAATVLTALVGYERASWGLDVNVRNLTNARYFIAPNGAGAYVGQPLSAFVSLHVNL